MYKYVCLVIVMSVNTVFADVIPCGTVSIEQVLAGPRHGAMIKVSEEECGEGGWICLDPNGEFMSKEIASMSYSLALAAHMANFNVDIIYKPGIKPSICKGYPLLNDIRTTKKIANQAIKQTYISVLDFALAATLAQNNHLHYGCL